MYDDNHNPKIFRVPPLDKGIITKRQFYSEDPNDVQYSFNASISIDPGLGTYFESGDKSALNVAISNNMGLIFTILNQSYRIYREISSGNPNRLDENAISIVSALEKAISALWKFEEDADKAKLMTTLNVNQFGEIFRRLPGFLAMTSGMLTPLLESNADEAQKQARDEARNALSRIVDHLNCNQLLRTTVSPLYCSKN